MSHSTITPQQLHELAASGQSVQLIDVRTPIEFREIHATIARNVPLDRLDPESIRSSRGGGDDDQPLYVICRSGGRGEQACQRLTAAGLTGVVNVTGGTLAWEQAGLPVVRGQKSISLERQVRIAAGTLVLVGAVLATTVHVAWVGLSAFVGAGLVFAGISNTCGMAMMLSRMPWNQVRGPAAAADDAATSSPSSGSCCGGSQPSSPQAVK